MIGNIMMNHGIVWAFPTNNHPDTFAIFMLIKKRLENHPLPSLLWISLTYGTQFQWNILARWWSLSPVKLPFWGIATHKKDDRNVWQVDGRQRLLFPIKNGVRLFDTPGSSRCTAPSLWLSTHLHRLQRLHKNRGKNGKILWIYPAMMMIQWVYRLQMG